MTFPITDLRLVLLLVVCVRAEVYFFLFMTSVLPKNPLMPTDFSLFTAAKMCFSGFELLSSNELASLANINPFE